MPEIREPEPDDWGAIAQLLDRPPSDGASLRRWTQSEYNPPIALVVTENSSVMGAAIGGITRAPAVPAADGGPDTPARLSFIGVAPRYRRHGHARALLTAFIEELRPYQARRLTAVAEGSQPEALAFLRAHGFETDEQTLGLVRPPGTPRSGTPPVTIRPLSLDDLPALTGLLIRLGMERAEAPHDALDSFTPAALEGWLQRPGTVAYAAWDPDDPTDPLGLAWSTRRQEDAVLRFVGVDDDHRRHGIGTALLASLIDITATRPLRATLSDPDEIAPFFRARGFEIERVTYEMSRSLREPAVAERAEPR